MHEVEAHQDSNHTPCSGSLRCAQYVRTAFACYIRTGVANRGTSREDSRPKINGKCCGNCLFCCSLPLVSVDLCDGSAAAVIFLRILSFLSFRAAEGRKPFTERHAASDRTKGLFLFTYSLRSLFLSTSQSGNLDGRKHRTC